MSRRKQAKPQHFQSDPEVASLPRRDGECSGPRRGHTHAHTHSRSHSHSRTPGPTHTRPPPRPLPRHRRVPARLSTRRIFFFLFNFPSAFAGLPPAPGKANTSPGRIFPELLGPPAGRRRAGRPCSSVPAVPGSGARDPPSRGRGPGVGRAAGAGRGRPRGAPRAPRAAPAALARPRPPRPCRLREGSLLRARCSTPSWGSPLRRAPHPGAHAPPGPHRRVGRLWGFRAAGRWGPVSGRPRLTRWARGPRGERSSLLVAPEARVRADGAKCRRPAAQVSPRISTPTHAPRPPEILSFGVRPLRIVAPRTPRTRKGRFPGLGDCLARGESP